MDAQITTDDEVAVEQESEFRIETYEELRERMVKADGHRSPCAMDW